MTIGGATAPGAPKFDQPHAYDALLVMSFGGPEGPDDVMPFLENVARGRNIPRERLEEVAEHYLHYGGISPINGQNRELIAALEAELRSAGIDLPIYFGNRNWHPMIADTIRQMREDGIGRALTFVTSGFSCWSGCRQYREDILRASAEVGDGVPLFDKIRVFYNHPGFIEAVTDRTRAAMDTLGVADDQVDLVFTAHSIPNSMAERSDYEVQLTEAARLVAEGIGTGRWRLVYQSRSGPPQIPWLEPDVSDELRAMRAAGSTHVVVIPIGFVSDHIEVLFDLDEEAQEVAAEIGLLMARAGSAGTHPAFIRGIRQLIEERMTADPVRLALGSRGPNHDICPMDCCMLGERPGRPKAEATA